jgi:protein kinase-like protein
VRRKVASVGAFQAAIIAAAVLKSCAGLAAVLVLHRPDSGSAPFPVEVNLLHVAVFGAVGAWLLLGGHQDERARYLGALYIVIAAMFADRPLAAAAFGAGAPRAGFALLWALDPVAFAPWLWWRFAEQFPRDVPLGAWQRLTSMTSRACGWAGTVLFAISIANALALTAGAGSLTGVPLPGRNSAPYWLFQILAVLGALVLIVRNTRAARVDEQRRARLFVAGLIAGFVPMAVDVLLEFMIPAFGAWMDRPDVRPWAGLVVYPLLLSVPLTTSYAVAVDQVLSVRLVVRQAIRYALTRATIVGMLGVPFAVLLVYLYTHRSEPVSAFLQGSRPAALGLIAAGAAALLFARRRLLTAVDRRFFREQYDAHLILKALIEESRTAASVEALADLIERGIDRALHLDRVALFVADVRGTRLMSPHPGFLELATDSALAILLRGSGEPLDVLLDQRRSPLVRLPEAERRWLVEGGFRLLVPIGEGQPAVLRGMIALGSKRSELPFSGEDRSLLTAIAASSAVVMENLRLRTPHDALPAKDDAAERGLTPESDPPNAMECTRCSMVQAEAAECRSCGGPLSRAAIPVVLRGVFRIECRIGTGGMGVVYRARDLNLGRPVAIKTLPEVSADRITRMRREARTMAALSHQHLATIYAVEVWRNTPVLVVEYFEAGTLTQRLARGPMVVATALRLGAAVADGLDGVHAAGILHRDVKPSNIAFTAAGVPKLLDFGLAKLVAQPDFVPAIATSGSTTALNEPATESSLTDSHRMIGTPLYLSPETVAMQRPDAGVDLWALAMVLYEAIAGAHPMRATTVFETMTRIAKADVPDIRTVCAACPPAVAEFLASALHKDRRRRPATAREMRERLEALTARL